MFWRVFILLALGSLGAGCSSYQHQLKMQKLLEEVKKDAIEATFNHLNGILPKDRIYYAAVGAPTQFENGGKMKVVGYEVQYFGIERDERSKKEIHIVRARVKFKQRKVIDIVNIKYSYFAVNEKKSKVKMQFAKGFPTDIYYSKTDPLKKYRGGKWVRYIKKRKLAKGMPEEALKLAWGEPIAEQIFKTSFGTKKVYGYGGYRVTLLNGRIDRWERDRS